MKLAIVGAEERKFTTKGMQRAIDRIKEILWNATAGTAREVVVISGACHLGGVDIWAEKVAEKRQIPTQIFAPEQLRWEFYKKRNLEIANACEAIHVIVVDRLPASFKGMKFDKCYHCVRNLDGCAQHHIKSGACWTALETQKLGKRAFWHVIQND